MKSIDAKIGDMYTDIKGYNVKIIANDLRQGDEVVAIEYHISDDSSMNGKITAYNINDLTRIVDNAAG